MAASKAPSVKSSSSRLSSTPSLSPTEIQRRLSEQKDRQRIQALRRAAEEENFKIKSQVVEAQLEAVHLTNTDKKPPSGITTSRGGKGKPDANRVTCLFCQESETGHYLETCCEFQKLTTERRTKWLSDNKRCHKCAKKHEQEECPFPKKCTVPNVRETIAPTFTRQFNHQPRTPAQFSAREWGPDRRWTMSAISSSKWSP